MLSNKNPYVFKRTLRYVIQPILFFILIKWGIEYLGENHKDLYYNNRVLRDLTKYLYINPYKMKLVMVLKKVFFFWAIYRLIKYLTYSLEVKKGKIIENDFFSLSQRDATDFSKIDDIQTHFRPLDIILGLSSVSFLNSELGRKKNAKRQRIVGLSHSDANRLFLLLSDHTADTFVEHIMKRDM